MAVDDDRSERDALQSYELVAQISALLTGRNPDVQGAVIAQLFAKFIAGHAPLLRETALRLLMDCSEGLVPVMIEEMIEAGRAPPEWRT